MKKLIDDEEKQMANGGIINDFDVNDSTGTNKLAGSLPRPPFEAQPQMSLMPPQPPTAPPAPISSPKPPLTRPLPGMPPDVTPDEISSYVNRQKEDIGKFGPQQQVDLENQLNERRNSAGYRATDALKGFSDALMQGVAEQGNPGNQKQFEEQQNKIGEEQMGTLQKAHEGQIQETGMGMKLDMEDPASPTSKAYRQSFAPIFAKMGYPPNSIAKMPASQIQTVADLGIKFADVQTQLELKKALLGVQTITAQGNLTNQKAERSEAEQKMRLEHPFLSALGKIPGGAASQDFESTYATLQKGTSYKGPDGKMRIKQ